MSPRSLLLNFILIVCYFCLFLVIRHLFHNEMLAALILIVVMLFLHSHLTALLHRIIFRQYQFSISLALQNLNSLNESLNREFRYHDISRILFGAFHELFSGIPYAFYILENNRYYLSHYENLTDNDTLPYAIEKEGLSGFTLTTDAILSPDFRFTDDEKAVFQKNKLTAVVPFLGHSCIFAFLLVDWERITFLKDPATRQIWEKIQKKVGLKLENSGLIIDLEKKNYEIRKIIEVSQQILSSLDPKTILDFIIHTLKTIVDYDAAAIFLLDPSGKRLLNTSSRGYDKKLMKNLHLKVGQGACGWVVKSKTIDILDNVRSAKHYIEFRKKTQSQISLPLLFEDEVLGVLCLESNQPAFFSRDKADILTLFANQASIAIHTARQIDIRLAKQAFEHELINAGEVQRGLLQVHIPKIRNLMLTSVNIPSKIVSGDLYDLTKFSDESIGLAIGDISGKGAPAALMMSLILAGLRTQNKVFKTTCDLIYRLNELLCQTTIQGKFASFFYAIINVEEHSLIYTNAGHNPPMLFRANGEIHYLSKGGIVMGFMHGHEYIQEEITFNRGDLLVAYTDGVTEAHNSKEEEFGEARLIELVQTHRDQSVYELKEQIIRAVEEFSNSKNPSDDITLIICKHL